MEIRVNDGDVPGTEAPAGVMAPHDAAVGCGVLLQHFMPRYQFEERHSLIVDGGGRALLPLLPLAAQQLSQQWLVRQMFWLREAPVRLAARLVTDSPWRARPPFGLQDFTELGRIGDHELALGLAGRFWRPDYGLVPLADGGDFLTCDQPGIARLVLWFGVEPLAGGRQLLHTCTRVLCHDKPARLMFRPYWYGVRMGSGFIRQRLLRCLAELRQ